MITVHLTFFIRRFGQYTQSARLGHSVLVLRDGAAYCLLVHPSVLTEEELQQCRVLTTTQFFRSAHAVCDEVHGSRSRCLVTVRGHAVGCLVEPGFLKRAEAVQ